MIIEIKKGKSGKWYWKIKADNGETLCHSETYSSKKMANKGFASLIQGIQSGTYEYSVAK